ncbi:hypothetical protein DEO72_LG10g959 [Vigna unguiculata]|uniref:Uncharacterized protein n=1 Tax=Vigna unguiculata TaxID=3917 RepID=A0A4D6N7K9_VIGUN|nr:hypothetical protein DEO72_LG10g959 [Vigna unguiculata]
MKASSNMERRGQLKMILTIEDWKFLIGLSFFWVCKVAAEVAECETVIGVSDDLMLKKRFVKVTIEAFRGEELKLMGASKPTRQGWQFGAGWPIGSHKKVRGGLGC